MTYIERFWDVQALKNIIETNAMDYNFEYYQLSMPTDMPVTILSTAPSLLTASVDVVLPLLPVAPFCESPHLLRPSPALHLSRYTPRLRI